MTTYLTKRCCAKLPEPYTWKDHKGTEYWDVYCTVCARATSKVVKTKEEAIKLWEEENK